MNSQKTAFLQVLRLPPDLTDEVNVRLAIIIGLGTHSLRPGMHALRFPARFACRERTVSFGIPQRYPRSCPPI